MLRELWETAIRKIGIYILKNYSFSTLFSLCLSLLNPHDRIEYILVVTWTFVVKTQHQQQTYTGLPEWGYPLDQTNLDFRHFILASAELFQYPRDYCIKMIIIMKMKMKMWIWPVQFSVSGPRFPSHNLHFELRCSSYPVQQYLNMFKFPKTRHCQKPLIRSQNFSGCTCQYTIQKSEIRKWEKVIFFYIYQYQSNVSGS